ncbi:MAG: hypothetical protein AB1774_03360 [Bacillota bacterium]
MQAARSQDTNIRKASAVLVILCVLAAGSLWLTAATARNYFAATVAASRFRVSVNRIRYEAIGPGRTVVEVDVCFDNGGGWPLSVTSMQTNLYLDVSYVWGQNFDWLNEPIKLPPAEVTNVVVKIEVPDTKADLVARGGEEWLVRVSGILEMPMLGSKLYRAKGVFPAKEVLRWTGG